MAIESGERFVRAALVRITSGGAVAAVPQVLYSGTSHGIAR